MSKFSCLNSCKKTQQLKNSQYCTGTYEIINGKIIFGCESNILPLSNSEKNFLTCHFYDLGIKDQCKICLLSCGQNLNPDVKRMETAKHNVSEILNSLSPLAGIAGVNSSEFKKAFDAINSAEINTNTSTEIDETIKLTNYARSVLTSIMSGKSVDIVEFKKIKEEIEKKYKK
jgi:hypothetical protein